MQLIQLTSDYEMKPFDCGDSVLNGFLMYEAKYYLEKQLAKTFLMDLLKCRLQEENNSSIFRFLTVDAYLSAIPFYERNGFHLMDPEETEGDTRAMFFDMQQL